MKSLNRVQKIFKIIEVVTKIIFVFCVIGLVLSVLGTVGVALVGNDSGTWAEINKTAQTTVDFNTCICYCIVGIILCAGETVLYYYVKEFYKKELAVGTPFDKTIVREMRKIAILHIAIPFGASIFADIVMLIFKVNLTYVGTVDLTAGLVYLVLSFLFDYGADLRQIEIETVKIREDIQNNDIKADDTPVVVIEPEKAKTKNEVVELNSQEINEIITNKETINKPNDKINNKTNDKNLVKKEKPLKAKISTTPLKPKTNTTTKKDATKNVASRKKVAPSNKETTKDTITKKTVTSKTNSTQEKEVATPKTTAQKSTTAKTTPKKNTTPKVTTKKVTKTKNVETKKTSNKDEI